jgi:hypothetical protein
MKINILAIQYKNKELVDSKANKIVTYKGLLEYIDTTIEYIKEKTKILQT